MMLGLLVVLILAGAVLLSTATEVKVRWQVRAAFAVVAVVLAVYVAPLVAFVAIAQR